MLCDLNVLITTQITQFFRMHDNTLVFPLVLSWLRYYPGDLFSKFCVGYGISNKTKNSMKYMDFLDHNFDASDYAAEFFVLC